MTHLAGLHDRAGALLGTFLSRGPWFGIPTASAPVGLGRWAFGGMMGLEEWCLCR